jgi:predicted transcriptional regulator
MPKKRRQQINKESATCGQNMADLNDQTIKAYNQNSVVKMNELNAFLQKVTTQVQAFEKIVTQSSTAPESEVKQPLYIGVANRTQGLRSWFVDGHPDED